MREFRWILHNLAAWRLGQLLLVAWALHQQLGCLEAVGWSYAGTSWYSYLMLFTPFHSIEKTKCSLCRLNEFNGRFSSGILDILIFGGVRAYKVSWKDTVILVQWSSSNFNLPKSSTPSRFYGFFRMTTVKGVETTNWTMWVSCQPHFMLLCGQNDKATHLPSATTTSFSLRGSGVWNLQPTLWICAVLCGYGIIWRYDKIRLTTTYL